MTRIHLLSSDDNKKGQAPKILTGVPDNGEGDQIRDMASI